MHPPDARRPEKSRSRESALAGRAPTAPRDVAAGHSAPRRRGFSRASCGQRVDIRADLGKVAVSRARRMRYEFGSRSRGEPWLASRTRIWPGRSEARPSRRASSRRSAASRTRWRCAGRTATRGGSGPGRTTPTRATRLAASLRALGVSRGDRVVLMMRNRPEFHVADVAVLLLGATPISIYNSSAPEQVQYLAGHCEASVAIVEDGDYLDRFLSVRGELPKLAGADHDRRARRGPARRCARLGRPPRRGTAGSRSGGRDRAAERRRDRHLHLRDDRPAQGRGARPREHLLDDRVPQAVPR